MPGTGSGRRLGTTVRRKCAAPNPEVDLAKPSSYDNYCSAPQKRALRIPPALEAEPTAERGQYASAAA